MRVLALCSLIVAAVFALDVHTAANAAAWCAASRNGGTNCGFYTYEQCRATVSGDGGSCNRNLFESGAEKPAARKERKAEPKPKRKEEKERVAPAEKSATPPAAAQPAPAPPAVVQQPVPAQQPTNNFQSARALIVFGKYEAGIAAMKALGYDEHPDVATYIGLAHGKLGRAAEARSWYEKALAVDPNHLLTLSYYGMLRAEQGDLRKAQDDLEKIKRLCGGTSCKEYIALDGVIASKRR